MTESKNLRDALLSRLATLPGTRRFHLHVLVSSPRKHTKLYPFVQHHPKTFIQDILVLLSEQQPVGVGKGLEKEKEGEEKEGEGEKGKDGEGWGPRVFVSAIEASLYTLPTTSSAILYISKVDSTGQSSHPSPTRTLARALLAFYADPTQRPAGMRAERVWVHLFARAQGQYLFPNSAEWGGKRALGDVGLCRWWKRVFEEVGGEVGKGEGEEGVGVRLFYVLPGMSEFEASQSMGVSAGASSQSSVSWHYGHPYSQTDIPLPCPPNADSQSHTHSHSHSCSTYNLGRYIPSFDDDPKARFIDELGYTTEAEGIKSPARKRQKTGGEKGKREEEGSGEREGKTHGHVPGELGKVCADEFWERMSFRQECVAGAMTGFFTMAVTSPLSRQGGEGSGGAAEQRGQVPGQMNKRVLASLMTGHEFSSVERARWSTGKLEETIRGLCEGLGPVTPPGGVREGCVGEGVGSLEKYNSDIYGSVVVCNAGGARGVCGRVGVTVLTARKKKRRGGGEEVMR